MSSDAERAIAELVANARREAEERAAVAESDLQVAKEQHEKLGRDLESQLWRFSELEAQVERERAVAADTIDELGQKVARYAELEARAVSELRRVESTVEELGDQARAAERDLLEAEEGARAARAEATRLADSLRAAEARIESLDDELAALTQARDERDKALVDAQRAQREADEARERARTAAEAVRTASAEVTRLHARVEEVSQERDHIREGGEAECRRLEAVVAQAVEVANAVRADYQQERARAAAALQDARDARTKHDQYRREAEQAQADYLAQIESLKSLLAQARQRIDAPADEQTTILESQAEQLAAGLSTERALRLQAEQRAEELASYRDALLGRLTEVEGDLRASDEYAQRLLGEVAAADAARVAALRATEERVVDLRNELQKRIDVLETQLAASQRANAGLEADLRDAEDEVGELAASLAMAKRSIEGHQIRLQTVHGHAESLAQRVIELRHAQDQILGQRNEALDALRLADERVQTLTDLHAASERARKNAEGALGGKAIEADAAVREAVAARKDTEVAERALVEHRQTIESLRASLARAEAVARSEIEVRDEKISVLESSMETNTSSLANDLHDVQTVLAQERAARQSADAALGKQRKRADDAERKNAQVAQQLAVAQTDLQDERDAHARTRAALEDRIRV